jgi:hypothetical protein
MFKKSHFPLSDRRIMKKLTTLLFVVLLVAFGASAATLSVNCGSQGPSPTEINMTFNCGQFNPGANQVLQSVQITVNGTISGTITLINGATTSQTGQGTTTSQFFVASLPGFTIPSPVFTAQFSTGAQSLAPQSSTPFSGLSGSGGATLGPQSSNLTSYTGAGTFGVVVTTSTGVSASGGGGQIGAIQSTQGSAAVSVLYTYADTTVPEPGTMVLIGMGLVGLGVWKFRK